MKCLLLKADFIAVYYHNFADLNFHTVLNMKQKLLIPNLLYILIVYCELQNLFLCLNREYLDTTNH
jgi:hypothetical protein